MANVTDPNVGGIDPLKPPVPPSAVVPPVGEKLPEIDARVRAEVVDLERRVAELDKRTSDGSGLEAAQELQKLAHVVQEKAAEIKTKAQSAFFGNTESTQEVALDESAPQQLNEQPMPTDVKEQIVDIEGRIAGLESPSQPNDPVAVADLLDNTAAMLEQKAEEIIERKRDVAAQELNDLDGFDR
jgi:hypothetical protein